MMSKNEQWRSSTGSVYPGQTSPDLLVSNRPVSATPIDNDRHQSGHRTGLRKRFRSLTEGLANLIIRDKNDKSQSSLKGVSGSPKKLRKSIFYVDHRDEGNLPQHVSDAPTKTAGVSRGLPRLTRSMSHGNSGSTGGGIKQVKAPPSPPPRRYTLWGLSPTFSKDNFLDTNVISNNSTTSVNGRQNIKDSSDQSTFRTSSAGSQPPAPPFRCSHHPQLSSISSVNSLTYFTPPSSPIASHRSWSAQYPATLKCNFNNRRTSSITPSFQFYSTHQDPFREESPYSVSSLLNVHQDESSTYSDALVGKLPCSSFMKTTPEQERRSQSFRNDQLCRSPPQDCKGSSRVGQGSHRGDWYRRKAAKARRSVQTRM